MNEVGAEGLRSTVSWSLLGLVIQRPSYGYELLQRFERTYGQALELSSISQVYTALDKLASRQLVERFSPEGEPERQPKPHYRPTELGMEGYREWLFTQLYDESRRARLFACQLAMLSPAQGLQLVARFEHACLAELGKGSRTAARSRDAPHDGLSAVAERLVAEQCRLMMQARLSWIAYARRELAALDQSDGRTGDER